MHAENPLTDGILHQDRKIRASVTLNLKILVEDRWSIWSK